MSEKAIELARVGPLPDSALRDISDERRRRYFTKAEARLSDQQEHARFVRLRPARSRARPAFSKLDLVSCRNVLIYFDQPLQKRVLPTFHYALNHPGFLLLGRTESISGFTRLFSSVDKTNKIFARTAVQSTLRFAPAPEVQPAAVAPDAARTRARRSRDPAAARSAEASRPTAPDPLFAAGRGGQRTDGGLAVSRRDRRRFFSPRPASRRTT